MISFADGLLLAAVLFGHGALWVALFNRVHALPFPCRVIKVLEKLHGLMFLAGPVVCGVWAVRGFQPGGNVPNWLLGNPWLAWYASICLGVAAVVVVVWSWRHVVRPSWRRWVPAAPSEAELAANHTTRLDAVRELGHPPIGAFSARVLAAIPGNQMFELHVQHKTLRLPALPAELDQLTIAHLSDLHFTGKITRAYFDFVIDQANALEADLVAVTGDIIDKAQCLDWIPVTLGRLRARHGVYFVLGNHDKRIHDIAGLRAELRAAGMTDLGGRAVTVEINGHPVQLAGNEWPWFGPRPELPDGEAGGLEEPFRILLAHTPDQLSWARRHAFPLMLAGHTHGGQIRLPIIGPVFTPSLHGTKYACGVFYERPTLMHVSRGISALDPIRMRCAPELARLILRGA